MTVDALLVLAVVAPAVAAAATWRIPSTPTARSVVQWACAGAGALWVVALLAGGASIGPLGTDGIAAPAAAGVAFAGAAVRRPLRRLPAALTGVGVTAGSLGLAIAGGGGAPVDAASGLVVAALAVGVATRSEADGGLRHAAAALFGAGLVGLGVAGLDGQALPTRGSLDPTVGLPVVAGAVVALLASSDRPRRALAPVLPLALAVVLPIATLLGDSREAVAGVVAAGAALVALRSHLPPSAAIALLAVAAGAATGSLEPALLLAAAAVIAHVAAVPVAAAAALPGATALAVAVAHDPGAAPIAVAGAAVVVAAGITSQALRPQVATGDDGARPGAWVALVLGAWLLVAPHTWQWAGDAAPRGWGAGAVVAATGAAVALAVLTDLGNRTIPLGRLDSPEPFLGGPDGRAAQAASAVALAVAGAAVVALVVSVGT